ncbi:MAG: ribonuclease Y [Lachnospiraceae bacterium]|nr:ribonuclease Y [Lachnospiraceae bacterium]
MTMYVIIGSLIVVVLAAFVAFNAGKSIERKNASDKVGSAENKARTLLDEAIKKAEETKVNALIEAKETILKQRTELENEIRERRKEVADIENRALKRDELSERKLESLEQKEKQIEAKEKEITEKQNLINQLNEQRLRELERVSQFTREQARTELFNAVKNDIKHDTALYIKEQEQYAKDEADKTAKNLVLETIQKCAMENVSYATVSTVSLPNDEMKGRIIGREGRNIRAIEQLTGVEVVIDDTPDTVVLSCFDPVRREIARLSLEKLILDGRIHPTRIEEIVEKATKEVEQVIKQKGEEAVLNLNIHGLNPEEVKLLGRMHYRTSYGQNALVHSIEVAMLSGIMATELGENVQLAKRAGLLHDIGKSIDKEVEGTHVSIGVDICKKYREPFEVINSVESHHGDAEARCPIAFIVGAADAISAARPGARRDVLETYTQRIKQLEEITNSYEGVEKAFAVQAGREVRIMVIPEKVSDDDMTIMAHAIAKQIQEQVKYPGTIKVNVIRETRAQDTAK